MMALNQNLLGGKNRMMHACIQDASRQDRAFTWSLRLLLGKCNTGMGWEKWAFIFFFIHSGSFSGYSVGCFLFHTSCESLREGLYYSVSDSAIELLKLSPVVVVNVMVSRCSFGQYLANIYVRCRYFCSRVGPVFERLAAISLCQRGSFAP
jgi:hypothetical protein